MQEWYLQLGWEKLSFLEVSSFSEVELCARVLYSCIYVLGVRNVWRGPQFMGLE